MSHSQPLGEVRPSTIPPGDQPEVPIPLLALRDREREASGYRIRPPSECWVPRCPVCAWRKAGLIPPVPD